MALSVDYLKKSKFKEYLGYCKEKGYMYSEYLGGGSYRIVSIKNGSVAELIRFKGVSVKKD